MVDRDQCFQRLGKTSPKILSPEHPDPKAGTLCGTFPKQGDPNLDPDIQQSLLWGPPQKGAHNFLKPQSLNPRPYINPLHPYVSPIRPLKSIHSFGKPRAQVQTLLLQAKKESEQKAMTNYGSCFWESEGLGLRA